MDSDSYTNENLMCDEGKPHTSEKNYFDGNRYSIEESSFDDFETEYNNFCSEIYKESDEDILNKYRYSEPIPTKKNRKIVSTIFLILAIAGIILTSVYSVVFVSNMINNKYANNKKITFEGQKKEDANTQFRLVTNKEWEKADLSTNKDASMILSSKNRNKGFLVICEGKSELGENVTLNDYFDAVKSENVELNKGIDEESIKDVTLVNGYEAKQLQVNINQNGEKYKYMITLVETNKSFYQLIGWTTVSLYAKSEKDFIEMTESFNEL